MAQPLKDVILKVILYLTDVVSDWLNGAEQITGLDFYRLFKNEKEQSQILAGNSTFLSACQDETEGPIMGLITIGLSWLPGIVAIIFCTAKISEQCQGTMVPKLTSKKWS